MRLHKTFFSHDRRSVSSKLKCDHESSNVTAFASLHLAYSWAIRGHSMIILASISSSFRISGYLHLLVLCG
ncbi:hypothetical protein A4A49_62687 [Nicotiana attenuata]|uniref:Uncharacterized protein n=1 Tax=Nicotiana attenuata TaxID=49451 RepID=A0A1J6IK99_NICAT|nr:hypothetical protein A4A49_62687 [Nicotiana attenuata]